MEFHHSITINRPIEKVWEFFQSPQSEMLWQPSILEEKIIHDSPTGVGLICREVRRFLGMHIESTWEITEFTPQRKIAYKSIASPITYEGTYVFESSGEGSKFTYSLRTGEARGIWRFISPLTEDLSRKQILSDLGRLKEILDAKT